ncbi:hypothetical protein EYA84_01935 [Verrucosispora sp. SN26_14.1]|uniref:hypothetical protein n=1 Tax=Verrucosispora sp. SN26_14.1 TaxID=2527879 RepID=UPI0010354B85|nr:hypothetical protein [Verrucosispora sp. SN26_14.1]TBL44225.1 hypothetical protein EYA84_01935 [Verrucosispora sp. SN26_14.1]
MTEGDRRPWTSADWINKFRDHVTPPPMLTERRPAVETMRDYARRGRFAASKGLLRNAGIAWCRFVAVPSVVVARTWEWLTERPARFVVVAVVVKLLTFIPPVGWLVDHVITPSVNAALWLFL